MDLSFESDAAAMTTCIIGWPTRRSVGSTARTVESLIVPRRHRGAGGCRRWRPPTSTRSRSRHFNAAFSAQDFTASLVLQASPDLRSNVATRRRECLRDRLGRVASGPHGDRGEARAHRARGRVEQ